MTDGDIQQGSWQPVIHPHTTLKLAVVKISIPHDRETRHLRHSNLFFICSCVECPVLACREIRCNPRPTGSWLFDIDGSGFCRATLPGVLAPECFVVANGGLWCRERGTVIVQVVNSVTTGPRVLVYATVLLCARSEPPPGQNLDRLGCTGLIFLARLSLNVWCCRTFGERRGSRGCE